MTAQNDNALQGNVIFPDFGGYSEPEREPEVIVASWTSEDFARVYVKYRPRLESYARKWLRDSTEVDEVIQDAFMYLFLSQPELDSELGVLKFLQWKTRLLCLDVLKAQGRRPITVLDDDDNYDLNSNPTKSAESEYENMVDAALVHSALARIPARQREILIRSEFQEQSTSEIAVSLGVSENATRQLLHRARASFRNELIEQVNLAGIEVSEILSVAVKKAREIGKQAGALIIALLLPALLLFGYQSAQSEQVEIALSYPDPQQVTPEQTLDTDSGSNNETSKKTSDEPVALKSKNKVLGKVTASYAWSPTVTLSNLPVNATGFALDLAGDGSLIVHLESIEGDKVKIDLRKIEGDDKGLNLVFSYLTSSASMTWTELTIDRLERGQSSKGDIIINAILVDSSGSTPIHFGISFTLSGDSQTVSNARIVRLLEN